MPNVMGSVRIKESFLWYATAANGSLPFFGPLVPKELRTIELCDFHISIQNVSGIYTMSREGKVSWEDNFFPESGGRTSLTHTYIYPSDSKQSHQTTERGEELTVQVINQ